MIVLDVSTLSYFHKMKDSAARNVDDTRKLRFNISYIILQEEPLRFQGNTIDTRDCTKEAREKKSSKIFLWHFSLKYWKNASCYLKMSPLTFTVLFLAKIYK